jgi:hypothetical protein
MLESRIKVNSIIENQLPEFVKEEFPLVAEFLSQYYKSLEFQGSTTDILQNIDQYIKVDYLTNLIDSTVLDTDITSFDSTILVQSTAGFPEKYGLLLIDNEIITYESKNSSSFIDCKRGFSGITSYGTNDSLVFSDSSSEDHISGVTVSNLSVLFLKEFFNKVKKQILPGFENRQLYSNLDERLFIKQSIDFYSSKGTNNSFKILFGALYGEKVDVILPRDYLIQPSDAQYRVVKDFVVEAIEGDPTNLVNTTLYQGNWGLRSSLEDESDTLNKSRGTITKVEKIQRNSKIYYQISLDYDYDKDIQNIQGILSGIFKINSKTILTNNTIIGSETLEVDSTVGFASSGTLIIDFEDGTSALVDYKSKTLNQFLGCSGLSQNISAKTEIKLNTYSYGFYDNNLIKIRILGVLNKLDILDETYFCDKDDVIQINTLGNDYKDYKSNNWIFNIPTTYEVQSISLLDSSDTLCNVTLFDNNIFFIGDSVTLISSVGTDKKAIITSKINDKSFTIQFGTLDENGNKLKPIDTNLKYSIRKNISKGLSDNYPLIRKYTTNVQNVYVDYEGNLYVASPSIPSYLNEPITINDRSIVFSGTFNGIDLNIGNHGLYTGDSIVYDSNFSQTNLGIPTGIYFVKKINNNTIRIAKSRDNIFTEDFISIENKSVIDNKFLLTRFTYRNLSEKELEPQKLIRKISEPENVEKFYKTESGFTGIFINGVELLNYKSNDDIFYGPIESIIPTSPGINYDIINPPILEINDPIGVGATGICSVIGQLERIDVIDSGFDYIGTPVINITGGNGIGAKAIPELTTFDHFNEFNSTLNSGQVKLNSFAILSEKNSIGFSSYHKFRDHEEVIYDPQGETVVGGLSTNSKYYVSVQNAFNIKLYTTLNDSVSGINTVLLTGYGTGNHVFRSIKKKTKVSRILIENKGSNYQNKKTSVSISGISTSLNIIKINNHGYNSGEIIEYNPEETPIGGLTSSTSYYVTKIDDNQFKLSQLGIGTAGIATDFYYNTNQYINFTSSGSGIHNFNYPKIQVTIDGIIGISTLTGQKFDAILQPVFRGNIQSVFVSNQGSNYGSEEIINYNRQPTFNILKGSNAQVTPIVSEGKIVDILINNPGFGYNSIPDFEIIGSGTGAIITPIIRDGSLIKFNIISGGTGYTQGSTSIIINFAGTGSKFYAKIKSWKINEVKRLLLTNTITNDDGILTSGIDSEIGIQYSHAYAPRKLRRSVLGKKNKDGELIYKQDLQIFEGKEIKSDSHSPVIGWAYDGNPIYGPYGYGSKTGGSIRSMVSGYENKLKSNRPSTSIYPEGFFIEDYDFTNVGDLDEHNGRFCITPEYPNGVYAYFCTISNQTVESFDNFREPVFPYVIGDTFKSKPIDFNFSKSSNQDNIDLNQTNWRRNTTPYGLLSKNSKYEYLYNPNEVKKQNSLVKSVTSGSVQSINVISGGSNYKIGDFVVFDNSDTDGDGAYAKVSEIVGKKVNQISVATSSFYDVEFISSNNNFLGFASIPHGYLNNDLITFTGKYDYKKSGNIKVSTNRLFLSSSVPPASSTGIVTYFNVYGLVSYPYICENDIYQIENEEIKVLNVDQKNSRIKVLRNQNNTNGLNTHFAGIGLTEKSRKFQLNFGITTSYSLNLNREFYFDPKESLGIGTQLGVGIVTTIQFSNPGSGVTQISIPIQSIYLPDHQLKTGDAVIYASNGGDSIDVSTDGLSSFQLQNNSILYVAKIDNNLIGISTNKVGLGTNGVFVGVTTSSSILYFTGIGTGNIHSFKTNYSDTLKGEVSKNTVTVSTASTHGLRNGDRINVNVLSGITTTFVVKYNDYNRRIVINPRSFLSSDVNIQEDTIKINNHGYTNGQKIIYNSNSISNELNDNEIYYVITIDSNKFRLASSYYDATKSLPNYINLTNTFSGTISPINPPLKVTKNQTIIFDLSDSSLSYNITNNLYSSFDFNIFSEKSLINEFLSTKTDPKFEVEKIGKIGIDSTAKLILTTNNDVLKNLYYNLSPIKIGTNPEVKMEIVLDNEVLNYNEILYKNSVYNGNYSISNQTSTTFSYNIVDYPEIASYSSNNTIEYTTYSTNTSGAIFKVDVINEGRGYKKLPGISSVVSSEGIGCILENESKNIGKINKVDIKDIGFNYPADYTIRPTAKIPDILKIESLSSFKSIKVDSIGKNYTIAPDLVVIDGFTNKIITDVDLRYNLTDNTVSILKNSTGISNVIPKIIPVNNSNGIGISSITYIPSTKDVVVTLGASFSDPEDFPFSIGDKILIENISVGIGSIGKGYNSKNYNYALFIVKNVDSNLGGIGATVSYSLSDYLLDGEIPGTNDIVNSYGRIIPEKHFPVFNVTLQKNEFYKGETIISESSSGQVQNWDYKNEYLKVSTNKDFIVGEIIKGVSSNSQGRIDEIISFDSVYSTDSSSIVSKGWNKETGFLNNPFQRIHDSDYYQYFSYALKSRKDFNIWENVVTTLNHTAGFKKFSDLIVESSPNNAGIETSQNRGDFTGIADLYGSVNLNCVNDFDLAKEFTINVDGDIKSNEIVFNSRIIQDYIESIGNRVLVIDDITDQFNSNPRIDQFSIIDSFLLSDFRSKKYIISINDTRYTNESQSIIVSLIHDNSVGFLNQYARVESSLDLGYFDFNIFGADGNLLFYPNKFKLNNYIVKTVSFSMGDIISVPQNINLGNVVSIASSSVTIPSGTNSAIEIVSIGSSYRSSKILVQIGSTETEYYEFNELTVLHDGTNAFISEYGKLTTDNFSSKSSVGLGDFNATLSGPNLIVELDPTSGLTTNYTVNTITVSIGDNNSTGISTVLLGQSSLNSSYVSIASSINPIPNLITTTKNDTLYLLVSVEDINNLQYQFAECIILSDLYDSYVTEFGIIKSNSNLGIISAEKIGDTTNIYFTPTENIDVQVRVFQTTIGLYSESTSINISNSGSSIDYDYGNYIGTKNDIKKDFDLKSSGYQIFERVFNAQDNLIVSTEKNTITLPYHYFITGEEVEYSYPGVGTTQSIGIATTSIIGIGITDKLPSTLFIVKVNDRDVRVASSATDALRSIPKVLDLTSVGIGTNHKFVSKKQNSKTLISIDNVIQSPITSTAVTSNAIKPIGFFDSEIYISGINSIFSGDLIKVGNEIMKVTAVGVGSTNSLVVNRPWIGSGISSHTTNSLVTKLNGNYNIVDNRIYFSDSPYGKISFSNISNRPDEIDYVGISTSSSFSGRVFLRSGVPDTNIEPYSLNYIFDDISHQFNGIKNSFDLISNNQNTTGFSTSNAIILINSIFQEPSRGGALEIISNYNLNEVSGITSVSFTGEQIFVDYDINTSSFPRGGIILSIGSTNGLGYQPLVSAGGTAVVSIAGTIQSISIGNSGSGYRSGIQTTVNVGVTTSSLGISQVEIIGTALVNNGSIVSVSITNPGSGYTSTNPPLVIFDAPLSYSNIPLIYSSQSQLGIGTEATVDIVVGQGSSVISFELKNLGYSYNYGDILTVSIGGTAGIPTDSSIPFKEFNLVVDRIYSDSFSGWSIGDLQVLDKIEGLFDGVRKRFPIKINNEVISIKSRKGSNIDVQATLLIFINDVLQVPGEGYTFSGGSVIRFTEPPKNGDTCKMLFYKGTGDIDTNFTDIIETIKIGDKVTLESDTLSLKQDSRLVTEIISTDDIYTNIYSGPGITQNDLLLRPVKWCRQTEDLVIDGQEVGKDRVNYEPFIQPTTNIIQNVGIGSTIIFVESVKTFFDSEDEYTLDGTNEKPQKTIKIVSQDNLIPATATAIVSVAGSISQIIINNGGVGYTTNPTVSIINQSNIGLGSTTIYTIPNYDALVSTYSTITTTLNSTISYGGTVSSINIVNSGFGYSQTNPPQILIEPPTAKYEIISNVNYQGDFGIIVGVSTTSVGVASTGIIFDFYIPKDSFLRNSDINSVGIASTGISGISTGYYFVVYNSNIGNGLTSLNSNGQIIGVGTQFMDNVYQVSSVSIAQTSISGIGLTYVAKVTVSTSGYNGLSGYGSSTFYGEYSWGRLSDFTRKNPQEFNYYNNGLIGISTSPTIQRYNQLKYQNYNT